MEVKCPDCGYWQKSMAAYSDEIGGNSIYQCLGCGHEFTEFETDGWRKGEPPCDKEMGDKSCLDCDNPSCPEFEKWADNDNVFGVKEQLDGCINYIIDNRIRKWVKQFLLERIPDYIWTCPASSTGKYHPEYALGEGGLIRHKRAAVQIALSLFEAESLHNFTQLEKDMIIAALILHDGKKNGETGKDWNAYKRHGQILAGEIQEECEKGSIRWQIAELIRTHMGHWSNPAPETELQKFVHLCDYLASRKFLEVNFDEIKV
ncbi:MAG: HD domain-containing protein [archaeon]